ncbi:mRNA splicing factor [Punctularia strigosozonata HHB-11173 SS5]|uniref:mRNA splicing factor n=1 Tax=Punctularia strigosozonata (strain HHB-11173) TaxID=741275 RepID=UPI00044162A6|nr:mRNA splicing factor [Punctularia strigosozonata HHB-11173 SS5]EIN07197.1 mRNA splicing factor [Punctularia strigosozonata HHB-11173 SS5]
MSLQEELENRKARLEALRARKAGQGNENGELATLVSHRNYDPATRTLRKHGRNGDTDIDDTVEKNVQGLAEKIVAEDEERRAQDLDLFNIAPKRANWDLKREMEKKLAKLERKTQEAIHTLIRQRLAAQKGQSDDIVGAMRAQERADDDDDDEDD